MCTVDTFHIFLFDIFNELYHDDSMKNRPLTQQERALALLDQRGIVRLAEFRAAGITAATIARMEHKGLLVQLSRGLYQRPDAPLDIHHALAEAAKRVPRGVICLASALAFHGLTDTIPSRVWMAVGSRDWRPQIDAPPIEVVRFPAMAFTTGIETHVIEGVPVRIYDPAKTVIDLFRVRRRAKARGGTLAIEGLKAGLRQRKATPAQLARYAQDAGIGEVVQPYLEALTVDA
jgi:predicted transcriptional regulator of viral defense system